MPMDLQPAQPETESNNSTDQPDSEDIRIFPYFDLSRRPMVFELPSRTEMDLECERHDSNDGRWICAYETQIFEEEGQVEIFANRQDAYEKMKELIKTTEVIRCLSVELESGSIFSLVDGDMLTYVEKLSLHFEHGFDERTNESYNRILRQVNPERLELLNLKVYHLPSHQKEQIRDQFLELERTTFVNLKHFIFGGHMNDEQLLGMRTPSISIEDSSAITRAGLVNLVQKVMLQVTPTETLVLLRISNELQMCLFGRLQLDEVEQPSHLIFNSVRPGWKVLFQFLKDDEYDIENDDGTIDNPLRIEINLIEDDKIFFDFMIDGKIDNSAAIRNFPSLGDFMLHVAAGLPENFPILHE